MSGVSERPAHTGATDGASVSEAAGSLHASGAGTGPAPPLPHDEGGRRIVSLVSTGGTISSRTEPAAGRRPALAGRALLAGLGRDADPGFDVRAVDVLLRSSWALSTADMAAVSAAVAAQLEDPRVSGVVITHGTDTLEETAYLLQLLHSDPRPVVLTGAIRPADDAAADGPRNLRHALRVAGSAAARGRGVLVAFDGKLFAAAGTRKIDTTASAAFDSPDFGAIGSVTEDGVSFTDPPPAWTTTALSRHRADLAASRVDIVALYPGADATALRACVAAGARGLVLEGTGSGNVPPAVADAVAELSAAGVVIAVSSRVHRGPILPLYGGGGGGLELLAAGAVSSEWLRPSQARIALLVLLATCVDPAQVRRLFQQWVTHPH
jgi:L-asparaginase